MRTTEPRSTLVEMTLPTAPAATLASCDPMSDPDKVSVRGTFSACAAICLTAMGADASSLP